MSIPAFAYGWPVSTRCMALATDCGDRGSQPTTPGPSRSSAARLTARVCGVVGDARRAGLTDADRAVVGDETDDERVHSSGDPVAGHAVDTFGVGQMDQPRGDPFDRSSTHRVDRTRGGRLRFCAPLV